MPACRGEYIVLTSDDDFPRPQFLERTLAAIGRAPFAFCATEIHDVARGTVRRHTRPGINYMMVARWALDDIHLQRSPYASRNLRQYDWDTVLTHDLAKLGPPAFIEEPLFDSQAHAAQTSREWNWTRTLDYAMAMRETGQGPTGRQLLRLLRWFIAAKRHVRSLRPEAKTP